MAIKIGLNGFGRIGRSVFRILSDRDEFEVVAVNDLFDNDQLAYVLKYDSVMGVFDKHVRVEGDALIVDDQKVIMTEQRDPAQIPWGAIGVDFVVEGTGVFRKRAAIEKHLVGGARKVVLTVPAKDEIDATIVLGVNDEDLKAEHEIVSNASCTTNCLAPVAKILDSEFGMEEGFITTIHAYTNDQRLTDAPHNDPRRSRAAGLNIIPTTTGAARAVGVVLPQLKGRLDGMAMRVPVLDGSIVDLVCKLRKSPSGEQINAAVQAAAAGPMKGILQYSQDPLVSTDIVGNAYSSIFDSLSTTVNGNDGYAKVVSWYDNEWGYSNRVVDLLARIAAFDA